MHNLVSYFSLDLRGAAASLLSMSAFLVVFLYREPIFISAQRALNLVCAAQVVQINVNLDLLFSVCLGERKTLIFWGVLDFHSAI